MLFPCALTKVAMIFFLHVLSARNLAKGAEVVAIIYILHICIEIYYILLSIHECTDGFPNIPA